MILEPLRRTGNQVAVAVAHGDFEHGDCGQGPGPPQHLPVPLDQAFILKLPKKVFQLGPSVALQSERLGNVALGRAVRVLAEKTQDRFPVRHVATTEGRARVRVLTIARSRGRLAGFGFVGA